MGITYGDHLIDSGYYDITPEQEREIEEREKCNCRYYGECDGSCTHPKPDARINSARNQPHEPTPTANKTRA
jgi:hypothetical protein